MPLCGISSCGRLSLRHRLRRCHLPLGKGGFSPPRRVPSRLVAYVFSIYTIFVSVVDGVVLGSVSFSFLHPVDIKSSNMTQKTPILFLILFVAKCDFPLPVNYFAYDKYVVYLCIIVRQQNKQPAG